MLAEVGRLGGVRHAKRGGGGTVGRSIIRRQGRARVVGGAGVQLMRRMWRAPSDGAAIIVRVLPIVDLQFGLGTILRPRAAAATTPTAAGAAIGVARGPDVTGSGCHGEGSRGTQAAASSAAAAAPATSAADAAAAARATNGHWG